MKMGINEWSFPAGLTVFEQMEMAKKAGFHGYEPAFSAEGPISLTSSEQSIREVARAAKDIGIELTSLASGLYWSYPCTSSDKAVREKSAEIIKKQLEAAAVLGVDVILVVPGMVASLDGTGEVVPYDVAYDRALETITSVADHAKACGVKIGVENVWNNFLYSPLEMRTFIDTINHPYVGVYFDVGNVLRYGYPEHWITILGKRIVKAHVKDWRRSVGTLDGFVDLLNGDVNFPAVMEAFAQVGYDDYIIAEMGGYAHYKDQVVYNTAASMKRIIAK